MRACGGQLFVGTLGKGEVWRYDGSSWHRAIAGGFGDAGNWEVRSMAVYSGRLYVGTYNNITGCEVWSAAGEGGFPYADWRQENADGFGDRFNRGLECMAYYFSTVHAGTSNFLSGCRAWSMGPTWYLAEGATAGGFETWVLVQNPGAAAAHVDFTLNTDRGEVRPPELQGVEIPAGSRRSFNLGNYVTTFDVSTKVSCRDGLVICERAVYWTPPGQTYRELGHDSIGYTP